MLRHLLSRKGIGERQLETMLASVKNAAAPICPRSMPSTFANSE
jgi:hypothetical protein